MKKTLVAINTYDSGILRIVEHIIQTRINIENAVEVIDITPGLPTPQSNYHDKVLRFFGLDGPNKFLETNFEKLGAIWVKLTPFEGFKITNAERDLLSEQEIQISVDSVLISLGRTDLPDYSSAANKRLAARLKKHAEWVFSNSYSILSRQDYGEIYVFNGRSPGQKALSQSAELTGTNIMYFEKGELPDSAFVLPYTPHDRILSQNSITNALENVGSQEIASIANNWLSRRAPAKNTSNMFSENWPETLPTGLLSRIQNNKVAGFFTSSQDEFNSIGPEWLIHEWGSQMEAFETVAKKLIEKDYVCYLRVHPNLTSKSHQFFKRERAAIRDLQKRIPELIVLWHDNPVNTYELLSKTDVAVVWNSTVGIEASARGIPVYTCAAASYDLTADVRTAYGPDALNQYSEIEWKVDASAAHRYIAYTILRDEKMADSSTKWVNWDEAQPPLSAKIAALFVSGGNATIRDSIQFNIDVWRHRSLKFNFQTLMKRAKRK